MKLHDNFSEKSDFHLFQNLLYCGELNIMTSLIRSTSEKQKYISSPTLSRRSWKLRK